ncbi:MAG: hypothetical protein GXP16_04040, partial [Gammaproteobacteria bacterium]|nr:hypothetical protein [Gammaproteobacteria bacterium]
MEELKQHEIDLISGGFSISDLGGAMVIGGFIGGLGGAAIGGVGAIPGAIGGALAGGIAYSGNGVWTAYC